jgi:hypothetical protein
MSSRLFQFLLILWVRGSGGGMGSDAQAVVGLRLF